MLVSNPNAWLSLVATIVLGVAFTAAMPSRALKAANSDPPTIHGVSSVLFNGNLYVTGFVNDDANPAGYIVTFTGDVAGTAVVQSDGRFWFSTAFYRPYGSAVVRTMDRDRVKSDPVSFEFHE